MLSRRAAFFIVSSIGIAWTLVAPAAPVDLSRLTPEQKDKLLLELIERVDRLERQGAQNAAKPKDAPAEKKKTDGNDTSGARSTKVKAGNSLDAESALERRIEELGVTKDEPIRNLDDAFQVPNSPAATALGLNPDTLPKADLPKEFNISGINGVDVRGNAQTGVAIDIAPAQLWNLRRDRPGQPGGALTVRQYAEGGGKGFLSPTLDEQWAYWRRVLTRTQISLAGARGTGENDKSIRLAMGINIPLLVSDDAVQIAYEQAEGERPEPFRDDTLGHLSNSLWHRTDWSIGAVNLVTAQKDGGEHFSDGGRAFWSTWRFAMDRKANWHFVANVTYRDDELVPVASTTKTEPGKSSASLVRQDSLLAGAGLQVGNDYVNATLFGAWLTLSDDIGGRADASRYGVALEVLVPGTRDIWFTASAGQELGQDHRPDNSFVLGGVKVGLSGDNFRLPFR